MTYVCVCVYICYVYMLCIYIMYVCMTECVSVFNIHKHNLTYIHTHTKTYNIHRKEGRKEGFYLMMHSTHFIYGYMASVHR